MSNQQIPLQVEGLCKQYGDKWALNNVSFSLTPGRITGLIGSNGSGKSTLMRLIAGLAHPDKGSVSIYGQQAGIATRPIVSFMPDKPITESWMRIRDAISFYADFYEDFDKQKAAELLAFMKLSPSDSVSSLSKGMNERLQLTLTLSRKAKLYLLDEPIGGVDPVARTRILDALVRFYEEDSNIIITTHLLHDIERLFDDVLFIKHGKLVLADEVENIRIQHGKSIDEMFREVYAEC